MLITSSEIANMLRDGFQQVCKEKNNSICFPRDIDVYISTGFNTVVLKLLSEPEKGVLGNMQKNDASFEAWCLTLRFWVRDLKDSVFCLRWNPPTDTDNPHYQRFLYRVEKFSSLCDWFVLEDEYFGYLEALKTVSADKVLLNVPGGKRPVQKELPEKQFEKLNENEVERIIVSSKRKNLAKAVSIDEQTVSYQLPVGVFKNTVSAETNIFTRGRSAIDLWALDKKERPKKLIIFELKKIKDGKKPSIGALTELFFYSMIMVDVQNKKFELDAKAPKNVKAISSSEELHAFLLTNSIHPLLHRDVINSACNKKPQAIKFGCISYDSQYNFKRRW